MMEKDSSALKYALSNNCVMHKHSSELLQLLEPISTPTVYTKNTHLEIHTDIINHVYLLTRGIAFEIVVNESGQERAIDIYKPGRILGASEAISDSTLNLSLKFISSCHFIKIPTHAYLAFIEKHKLSKRIIKCNQLRTKIFQNHLTALQLGSHEERIEWAIEQLRDKQTNKLVARNIDIATLVGCSKETVSRVISNMGNVISRPKQSSNLA